MSLRRARASDLDAIVQLCREHAEYERAKTVPSVETASLSVAMNTKVGQPRLFIWVVEVDDQVVGFASATLELSTWEGREFLHLDCLYLRPEARGQGWGSRLLMEVRDLARGLGCREMQWQTPPWNERAIDFYEKQGARAKPKLRFSWRV